MFEFEPTTITKEILLNTTSEEAYFAFYLGVNPTKDIFRSPLREDENPTCSFYRDKNNNLIYKDFATGFHGNFISVVMKKFNVPYYKAINIIANDFGIIKKPHYTKNEAATHYDGTIIDNQGETTIQIESKEYTKQELDWWTKFGISEKTLKKFRVYSVKHVFLNGNYMCTSSKTNPIYGYYFGTKDGRELWKIYFPFKKKNRFLLNTSIIQGITQMKHKDASKDLIVVTKSYKDVMSLYELGITAIAPQAESIVLTEKQMKTLEEKYKYVIVNGDWDRSGQKFMYQSRKIAKCICLSFKNKQKFGKDMSDFIALHGIEKAKTLVEKLKLLLKSGKFNYQLGYCK